MLQRFRRLLNSILLRLKQLFGVKAESMPSAPTAHTKIDSTAPRTGPVEPELGLASAEPAQYRKRESVFTYREHALYKVLIEEVGDEYLIFAKVRLGDFVFLANEPADRKYHNNQIQCKHVDFLLCEKDTQQPLMAIELDDSSHEKYDRRESDEFKSRLFAEVGLQLLRVKVQSTYPRGEIGKQIRDNLHGK